MKTQLKRKSNAGVTLIEMLVVVTIIARFATLVAPGMFKQGDKAKMVAARVQINNFEQALKERKLNMRLSRVHDSRSTCRVAYCGRDRRRSGYACAAGFFHRTREYAAFTGFRFGGGVFEWREESCGTAAAGF